MQAGTRAAAAETADRLADPGSHQPGDGGLLSCQVGDRVMHGPWQPNNWQAWDCECGCAVCRPVFQPASQSSAAYFEWQEVAPERLPSPHGIEMRCWRLLACRDHFPPAQSIIEHWCVRVIIWQTQLDLSVNRDAGRYITLFLRISNKSTIASSCIRFLL